jgi:hypothetical protein
MPKRLYFSLEDVTQLCEENGSKLVKVHSCKQIDLKTEITFTCVRCGKNSRDKLCYVRTSKRFQCKEHKKKEKTSCSNPNGYSVSSGRPALYIIEIPKISKIKFGCTNNLSSRIRKHEYDFKEIVIVYIIETDNALQKESLLKQELRALGIDTLSEFNGKRYTEIVDSDSLGVVQNLMFEIVNRNNDNTNHVVFLQNYIIKKMELEHEYRMTRCCCCHYRSCQQFKK